MFEPNDGVAEVGLGTGLSVWKEVIDKRRNQEEDGLLKWDAVGSS